MKILTFYFDRTFGVRLPSSLAKLKPPMRIKWHQEQGFDQSMGDDKWMSIVGPKDWIVVSQDRHFHLREAETTAVKQHNIKCFYFPCSSDSNWHSLGHFVRRHEKMIHLANEVSSPFIFELKKNGQFYRIEL